MSAVPQQPERDRPGKLLRFPDAQERDRRRLRAAATPLRAVGVTDDDADAEILRVMQAEEEVVDAALELLAFVEEREAMPDMPPLAWRVLDAAKHLDALREQVLWGRPRS